MNSSRSLPLILVIVCLNTACSVPTKQTATLETQLRTEVTAILDGYDFPGITAAVVNGQTSLSVAAGFANLEAVRLMTTDTPMLAASIGKTYVAASVMQLSAEGILKLDAPISDWLGNKVWFERLSNGETMTIRHLLQHTSGLRDHVHAPAFAAIGLDQAAELGPEGLISLVLDESPLFPAGEGWSYSDTGYLILGLIIEEATDLSFEELVQSRLLKPARLKNTGPSNRIDIDGLARGYVSSASGFGLPKFTTDDAGNMVWNPVVEWAGGGFYSTADDLANWGYQYISGDLLGKFSLAEITSSVATSRSDPSSFYGLGLSIHLGGDYGPAQGHRGWIPGYVSSLQYYPDYDTAISFQINTDIGIIDADTPVVSEIEERLAKLVFELVP